MNRTYVLNSSQENLNLKLDGKKLFEIRLKNFKFHVGDVVIYGEKCPLDDYPFKEYHFEITYITDFQQVRGWEVFGERFIKKLEFGEPYGMGAVWGEGT